MITRVVALVLVVGWLTGCATVQRLGERLCSVDFIHATFCDVSPEEPTARE